MKKMLYSIVALALILVLVFVISVKTNIFASGNTDNKIHVSVDNDDIAVYLKSGKSKDIKYLGYDIKHSKKPLDQSKAMSNYDVWNLSKLKEYKRLKGNIFVPEKTLINGGEWELAIKEHGANDFVGGIAHGDEITKNFKLIVDGKIVNSEKDFNGDAEELKFTTESQLYRDNTTTEDLVQIGTHIKTYTFNKDGLTLDQSVKFNKDMVLDRSYMTMLPIHRTWFGIQISDNLKVNNSAQDISSEFEIKYHQATKATVTGKESGLKATVEILDKSPKEPTGFFVTNSPNYNKMYFYFVDDGYHVKAGETWSQTSHFSIDVN